MASEVLSPLTDPGTVRINAASVSGETEIFPATRGEVTPLIDAPSAFKKMFECMSNAQHYIYLSAWYLQSQSLINGVDEKPSFKELLKKLISKNKALKIRILISYLPSLIFPDAKPAASFKKEMMSLNPPGKKPITVQIFEHPFFRTLEKNKVVLGTSHDKMMVIDGKFAFCGGIEFTVEYNKSDHRHDIHSFIEGPVVAHLEEHFVTHWTEARAKLKTNAKDPRDAGDLALSSPSHNTKKTTHAVQLSITKSKDGAFNYTVVQKDVFETYKKAISAATKYIYIENQYFRDMSLAKLIADRISSVPDLRVMIVLPHDAEENPKDPQAKALTDHAVFVQWRTIDYLLQKDSTGKNVGFFSLQRSKSSKTYVHAKVMIIDDLWFTIGSANANPRSFYLDAETNISVRDNAAARDFRLALWKEHFGADAKSSDKSSLDLANAAKFLEFWKKEASENAKGSSRGSKPSSKIVNHKPARGKERPGNAFEPNIDMLVKLEERPPDEIRWPQGETAEVYG